MDPFVGRFDQLIDYLNITPYKLAKEISTSEAIISNIRAGKTKPSYDFLQKLLNKYKVINANWLIVGIGDMLLNKTSPVSRDTRDGKTVEVNIKEFNSLLESIKVGQEIINISCQKILAYPLEKETELSEDISQSSDLVKTALERLGEIKKDQESKTLSKKGVVGKK